MIVVEMAPSLDLTAHECLDFGDAMYRAAVYRDMGVSIQDYKLEMEMIHDQISRDEKDEVIYRLIIGGVTFVYSNKLTPDQHKKMSSDNCLSRKGKIYEFI